MRIKSLKSILLLASMVTSIVASTLALTNTSYAKVYDDVNNIFIRGLDSSYGTNLDKVQPLRLYAKGDNPPFAMTQKIASGAVIAWGAGNTCRGGTTYTPQRWVYGELDVLLDVMLKWMKPGATRVLWYGDSTSTGYEVVYNDAQRCSWLIADLKENFEYTIDDTIDGVFTPIDDALLSSYDILVLPGLQLGDKNTGGDNSLLPDSVVQVIQNFVEGGGGLLLMDSSDFGGYNYYKVSDKILKGLNFNSRREGVYFGFQSDSIYDDQSNHGSNQNYWPRLLVDNTTEIGSAYQAASGKTTIDVYGACSLIEIGPGIVMYGIPEYEVGLPGETLTYRIRVFNTGNADLTINLTVSDGSGWGPTLENTSLGLLKENENRTTILSVTIPHSASISGEDTIVVTATAVEYPNVTENVSCTAHVAKHLEVTEDSYVDDLYPDQNFGDKTSLYVGRFSTNWQYAVLKFDNLDQIPLDAVITSARLYLFCWNAYGAPQGLLCTGVVDDSWTELDITWNNMPATGATLDTTVVTSGTDLDPKPYYWNVTSFIQEQFAGDKTASFCVRPPDNAPESDSRTFEAREWWDSRLRPFLQVTYPPPIPTVSVSVKPDHKFGSPGSSISYTVTVTNGNTPGTYSLTTADNAGWSRTISQISLPLAANESRQATLTVAIPSSANVGTVDNVRIIATGASASAETSCTAQASTRAVEVVSIIPTPQDGLPGAALTYTVTVKNTGVVADNYVLTKSDNAGWTLGLSPSTLSLTENASGTATLTVTIPKGAENDVYDSVTVTATSQTDSSVSDSKSCTAHSVENRITRVHVTISPASSSGNVGSQLRFSVTIRNNGTATDTFNLDASDTQSWGPTLSVTPPRITLTAGSSRTIVLTVKIPSTATEGDSSKITVTATSQTDSTVTSDNTCTAIAGAPAGGLSPLVIAGVVVVVIVIIAAVLIIKVV